MTDTNIELNGKKEFNKRLITFIIGALFVMGLLTSFAYYTFFSDNTKRMNANLSTGSMSLVFSDGDNGIDAKLQFGETVTKKFTIENTGTLTGVLSFEWDSMVNTYSYESLSYNLEYCTENCDGENAVYTELVSKTNMPVSEQPMSQILASEISVPANSTYYYNLNITLNNLKDKDQMSDVDAIFTTHFQVGEASKYRYYNLRVDPNGGVWNNFSSPQEYKLMHNETKEISEPIKEGYSFDRWEVLGVDSSLEDKTFTMGITDTTLRAIWGQRKYTITININGEEKTVEMGVGDTIDLEVPEVEGKEFTGWDVTGGTVEDNKFTLTDEKDATINAVFNNKVYNYKVIHRQMNPDGTNYTIIDTETGSMEHGKTLEPEPKSYLGFASPSKQSKTIEVDSEEPTKNIITYDYTRNRYTLTIDPNGGSYSGDRSITLYYEESTNLSEPTKDGHIFSGWDKTSGELTNTTFTMGASDAKITAKWISGDFDYIVNHKTMNTDGSTYTVRETQTGNANFGTEVFPDVKTYPGFTSPSSRGLTITSDSSKNILDYLYERNKYELTIKPNGGSYENSSSNVVKNIYYEANLTLATPTRDGYTFTGWTNEGGSLNGQTFTMSDTNTASVTANWSINSYSYTVNHYQMNTDGTTYSLADSHTEEVEYASEVTPAINDYKGFTAPVVQTITVGSDPSENVVNYYYSRNRYTLTIDPASGIYNDSGEIVTRKVYYDETIDLGVSSKTGYNFSRWKKTTEDDALLNGTMLTMKDSDLTVKAVYSPKTMTITFNANGGTTPTESKNVSYDSIYDELPEPNYEGYEFLGWFTDISEGEEITNSTKVTITEDQTLYAHWRYATFQVTFDPNGGSVDTTTKNVTYGKPYGDLPTPTRSGYDFVGWYNKDSGGELIESSTPVSVREDHTLYAHYEYAIKPEEILNVLGVTPLDGTPNFVESAPASSTSNPDTTGVYKLEDDYGNSYYYRGAMTNNYIKFAGYYWRIIRVNGDGSLRIIYDGTQGYANGTSNSGRLAITSNAWNNTYSNDNKYVGYMYGGANGVASTLKLSAQTNSTNTNIKNQLENWYWNNIGGYGFDKYVSDTLFCNDRSTADTPKTWWTNESTSPGFSTYATAYGHFSRFFTTSGSWNTTNPSPSFKCTNKNDAFTKDDITKGNGSLRRKVGLITSDEVIAAGSGINKNNSKYYLYKGSLYYTMTPHTYNGGASVASVSAYGALSYSTVTASAGIVPVINLSSDYVLNLKGSGTTTDPFRYSDTEIKITLNTNGGTLEDVGIVKEPGDTYGTLPEPTRNGYIFDGWYTDATAGTKIEPATEITATTNYSIYAHWTPYIDSKATETLRVLGVTPNPDPPAFNKVATTDEGVFSMQDDYGTSYYYRGNVEDNYVFFAGHYWRIIRVNGDGSLRIIYDGNDTYKSGEVNADRFALSAIAYNTSSGDNKYVGYMFSPAGTAVSTSKEQAQTNENDSVVKAAIEGWYKTEIEDKGLDQYVSDELFCNDRSLTSGLGYTTNASVYGPYTRTYTYKTPQFTCPQQNDRFTKDDTAIGNGSLNQKIGLITADEISAAGGLFNTANASFYLNRGAIYRTMSPYSTAKSGSYYYSYVFGVAANGGLSGYSTSNTSYIAPVINLSYEYVSTFQGTGTTLDPYREYNENEIIIQLDAGDNVIKPTHKIVEVGKPYGTLPTIAKTGYTFYGWYTEADGNGTKVEEDTIISISSDHTLYAHILPNTYTVTLNGNGVDSVPPSKTVTYNSTYGELPNLEREGYTFNGWYTATSGGTKITESTAVTITANQTLYARWTANTYTITYNANSGSCTTASKNVTFNSTYGTLATPTRTGYNFVGWFTDPEGGTQITASTKVTIANNFTVYAHWTLKSITISYNVNGGVNNSGPTSKTVTWGDAYGAFPSNVTRAGYTFNNWWTAASGGSRVYETTTVSANANHSIYAHWTANTYTVLFDPTEGSCSTTSTVVTYDSTYGTLPTPYRSGYDFVGWYTSSTGGTQISATSTVKITDTTTLYARWKIKSYTITFNANGGSPATSTKSVPGDSTYGTLPTASRTGFTFAGWWTSASGGTQITSDTPAPTYNLTLYAHWNGNSYTYTFDANGGTFSNGSTTDQLSVTFGQTYNYWTTPILDGYELDGWWTAKSGGTRIGIVAEPKYAANQTFYAHWKELFRLPKAVKYILNRQTVQGLNTEAVDWTVSTKVTNEGVRKITDDYGTSYYYRGRVDDNYLKFAGYYWRVIRINGDGSVRIQYDGTYAHPLITRQNGTLEDPEESEKRVIGETQWATYNNDNKYIYYMYGGDDGVASTTYANATTNTTNSNVKKYLENWYATNIQNKGYGSYVVDRVFCNDRSVYSGSGFGKNEVSYKASNRNQTHVAPIIKCPTRNDAFTVSDTTKGNGKLSYPIGMITIDELILSGYQINHSLPPYTAKGVTYWVMTPNHVSVGSGYYQPYASTESSGGGIGVSSPTSSIGVAPVINLDANYVKDMIGDGTADNPYRASGVSP